MPLRADERAAVIENTAERIARYVIAALRTPEGAEMMAGELRRQGWMAIPPTPTPKAKRRGAR
jgi:hypothetical protein